MAVADEQASVTHRFRAAVLAGDLIALAALLDPDVVLRSPVTTRFAFVGRDEVIELLAHALDLAEDVTYTAELHGDRVEGVVWSGRFGGRQVEESMLFRLGDDGLIREITVFVRPLAGVANFAAVLAPRLARSRAGRGRALLARLLTRPVEAALRRGDALAPWLAGRR
jgi:ketosteroid isomerase-like protein